MNTYTSASHAAILNTVLTLPAHIRSSNAEVRTLLQHLGNKLLSLIRDSFIIKSKGGTDEAGDRWAPLAPSTIAQRRRKAARSRIDSTTTDQWRRSYQQGLVIFKGDKASAARRAWMILKSRHLQAHDTMRGRPDILNDTGLLLRSLSPEQSSPYRVFRTSSGTISIGTTRPGASAHHNGVPGRLPQRRLWPDPSRWPASWRRAIMTLATQGIADITTGLIRTAR